MPEFEFVIKPLEVKKKKKTQPNSDKKPFPSKKPQPLQKLSQKPTQLHKQRGICACSSVFLNISFWSMASVCVYLVN